MPNKKLTMDEKLYKDLIIKKLHYKCEKCECEYLYYDYGLDFNKTEVEIIKFANMDV